MRNVADHGPESRRHQFYIATEDLEAARAAHLVAAALEITNSPQRAMVLKLIAIEAMLIEKRCRSGDDDHPRDALQLIEEPLGIVALEMLDDLDARCHFELMIGERQRQILELAMQQLIVERVTRAKLEIGRVPVDTNQPLRAAIDAAESTDQSAATANIEQTVYTNRNRIENLDDAWMRPGNLWTF